jgi:hypothetical protein
MFLTIRYLLCTAVVYSAFFVSAGLADQILVNNPSFENQPLTGEQTCGGTCEYDIGPIPGWNDSGTAGQFMPTPTGTYFNYIPDGQMVAYTNGGTISQTVSATVQAGETYFLNVFVGNRADYKVFDSSIDLLVNGNTYTGVGVAPTPGNWSVFTATYVARPADVGASITIELKTAGLLWQQAEFDDVTLLTSNPEPAYIGIMAMALLGFVVYRQRKERAAQQLS